MRTIDLEKWRGHRDPTPLDPATMLFRAQRAESCRGCIFDGQWASVCKQAAALAVSLGLNDCDSGVIYVATSSRQLELFSGATTGATAEAPNQVQNVRG